MQARPYWLQADGYLNVQFRRRWVEPSWVLRLDAIRDKPPDERQRPGAVPTARRPFTENATSSTADNSRIDNKRKARRAAERLFCRAGAA